MIRLTTACPDLDTARDLAHKVLTQRLAACATLESDMITMFQWEGMLEEHVLVQLTFRTIEARRPALVAMIEANHPFDLPLITWEDVNTTAAFDVWLHLELGE
ncbi:divalent cation tolerance protein CutA [Actibacterium sp. MT2.3-13A]|uniref:divalent-cation tolerance protein CutA n=1 Tax=Actibacterium sp. MT2.3-13A TaxID=2828332 RepID=UPI001BA99AED|nr:divalent cation tolerance protein CutA [Actibacterium sp. MT2.3-13A]